MKISRLLIAALFAFQAVSAQAEGKSEKECVGYATLNAKGNVQLNLFSKEDSHGGAMLLLDPLHPLYESTLTHVGKLKKGQWKCVKPFPDETKVEKTKTEGLLK